MYNINADVLYNYNDINPVDLDQIIENDIVLGLESSIPIDIDQVTRALHEIMHMDNKELQAILEEVFVYLVGYSYRLRIELYEGGFASTAIGYARESMRLAGLFFELGCGMDGMEKMIRNTVQNTERSEVFCESLSDQNQQNTERSEVFWGEYQQNQQNTERSEVFWGEQYPENQQKPSHSVNRSLQPPFLLRTRNEGDEAIGEIGKTDQKAQNEAKDSKEGHGSFTQRDGFGEPQKDKSEGHWGKTKSKEEVIEGEKEGTDWNNIKEDESTDVGRYEKRMGKVKNENMETGIEGAEKSKEGIEKKSKEGIEEKSKHEGIEEKSKHEGAEKKSKQEGTESDKSKHEGTAESVNNFKSAKLTEITSLRSVRSVSLGLLKLSLSSPSHSFSLLNTPTSFPFTHPLRRQFSLQTWFRVNMYTRPLSLFELAGNDEKDSLCVRLMDPNHIVVESRGESHVFCPQLDISVPTHLVLVYDGHSLVLHVNGESESVVSVSPCVSQWTKLYVHHNEPLNVVANEEILVTNLCVLSAVLPPEWVCLLYELGVGYFWDTKDFSDDNMRSLMYQLPPGASAKARSARAAKWPVCVDMNAYFEGPPFYKFCSAHTALYAIGGAPLLVHLAQAGLDVVFAALGDWRIRREFENMNGYAMLAMNKRLRDDPATFQRILSFALGNPDHLSEAMITNVPAYRSLVLDFHLWHGTSAFGELLSHFSVILSGRYREHNSEELTQMKALKKMIEFAREKDVDMEEAVAAVLAADGSVEAIRSVSLFVVYKLEKEKDRNKEDGDEDIATSATFLRALTSVLCDSDSIRTLKKFSRSISIHWVLLLLSSASRDVVVCAVRLLNRLLRVLGTPIINRFFGVSHGLEILTRYLGPWWHDDVIVGLILEGALKRRKEGERGLVDPSVVIFDFLYLLNNMVLFSLRELADKEGHLLGSPRQKPNHTGEKVLRLVATYTSLVGEHGEALGMWTAAMVERLVEVMGHLRVICGWNSDFQAPYRDFCGAVAALFVKRAASKEIEAILDAMGPFAQTVAMDSLIPPVFSHVNSVLGGFVHNERAVVTHTHGLVQRYSAFMSQYAISDQKLAIVTTTMVSLAEVDRSLGLDWRVLAQYVRRVELREVVEFLLYRQVVLLEKLTKKELCDVVMVLVERYRKREEGSSKVDASLLNFLRSCALSCSLHGNAILEWTNELTRRSDDEALRRLSRIPEVQSPQIPSVLHSVNEIVRVSLHNGGTLGLMDTSSYVVAFSNDCERLRQLIIDGESAKAARAAQDHAENARFFAAAHQKAMTDVSRILGTSKPSYCLDYIENDNGVRGRLVVEDQVPEHDKLTYSVEVPKRKGMNTGSLDSFEMLKGSDVEALTDTVFDRAEESLVDNNRKILRSLFIGDQILSLWNVNQLNGLVPLESLMILGTHHVYLIDGYHHLHGNVVEISQVPPESRDPIVQLIAGPQNYPHRTKTCSLSRLTRLQTRHFLLRDIAVEMFFSDGASVLITCTSTKLRDEIYARISPYAQEKSETSLTRLLSAFSAFQEPPIVSHTRKWRDGLMSNFDYLMVVNTLAGRTFNDLTQYPVFPWVLADYTSEELDLSNPRTFRDLSKPMGAQNPARAAVFRERYEALASLDDPHAPPFHYGTHYSSAMIVTSFLIRVKPHVQSYLLLQGGKFDHADRLFSSVSRAWRSASSENTTDVRELVPEFFYLAEMFVNANDFDFGVAQNGVRVNHVELPPWAKGDPHIFVQKHREALESPYVSANLHLWIDLVFGVKQSGQEAVDALNVFHHLSYSGGVDVDGIRDSVEKRAVIGAINNFGQTPMRLFGGEHRRRLVLNTASEYISLSTGGAGTINENILSTSGAGATNTIKNISSTGVASANYTIKNISSTSGAGATNTMNEISSTSGAGATNSCECTLSTSGAGNKDINIMNSGNQVSDAKNSEFVNDAGGTNSENTVSAKNEAVNSDAGGSQLGPEGIIDAKNELGDELGEFGVNEASVSKNDGINEMEQISKNVGLERSTNGDIHSTKNECGVSSEDRNRKNTNNEDMKNTKNEDMKNTKNEDMKNTNSEDHGMKCAGRANEDTLGSADMHAKYENTELSSPEHSTKDESIENANEDIRANEDLAKRDDFTHTARNSTKSVGANTKSMNTKSTNTKSTNTKNMGAKNKSTRSGCAGCASTTKNKGASSGCAGCASTTKNKSAFGCTGCASTTTNKSASGCAGCASTTMASHLEYTTSWVLRPPGIVSLPPLLRAHHTSLIVNKTVFLDVHPSSITVLEPLGHRSFLSASCDGIIHAWRYDSTLHFEGILRGHVCCVTHIASNASWKVAVSADSRGKVLVWDTARYAYMRELFHPEPVVALSVADSGHIAVVSAHRLCIYTLNGCLVYQGHLDGACAFSFGITDSKAYWKGVSFVVAYEGRVEVCELVEGRVRRLGGVPSPTASAVVLRNTVELDTRDRLVRGGFEVVVGGSEVVVLNL